MKRILSTLGLATVASLLAASAAQATVTAALVQNVATTSSSDLNNVAITSSSSLNGETVLGLGAVFGKPNFDHSTGIAAGTSSGATFVGESNLSGGDIFFKNGLISVGTESSGTIGVAVTFTNTHSFSYRPVLQSTLLAAGMGIGASTLYINDAQFNAQTCNTTQLKNCGALDTGDGVLNFLYPNGLKSFGSASAGFTFDVSVNGASIYNLNGQMTSTSGGIVESFNGADQVLNNFTRVRNDNWGTAYTWDDTQVDIQLPDMLDPGQSVTAIYTISTSAASPFGGFTWGFGDRTRGANVLAYSSFGDPTGGKNPIQPESGAILALSSGLTPMDGGAAAGGINLDGFAKFTLPIEMVDEATQTVTAVMNGVTTFAANNPYPYGGGPDPEPSPVPEPAMLGLFALGAAALGLKRRRRERFCAD